VSVTGSAGWVNQTICPVPILPLSDRPAIGGAMPTASTRQPVPALLVRVLPAMPAAAGDSSRPDDLDQRGEERRVRRKSATVKQ